MTIMRELRFINQDATPKEAIMTIDVGSIAAVMSWYGAYYAGDRYQVRVNGKLVKKDQNGELSGSIP